MLQALHIPKCCRQPRSRSRPSPLKDFELEVSSVKDGFSSSSIDKVGEGGDGPLSRYSEARPEISLFPCSNLCKGPEEGIVLNSIQIPVSEVESVSTNDSPDSCKNRNTAPQLDSHVSACSEVPVPSTPGNSRLLAAGDADVGFTPGSLVWAKTVYYEWWPAEVMNEKLVQECVGSQCAGQVLVQLIGNDQHSWHDPVDLSQFDHCYEERSKNPLKEFQDALKQALNKRERRHPTIWPTECSGELKSSTPEVVLALDAWNTPSSSRTKDDSVEEGRARRKRKLKLHFDELNVEEKPNRRLRRLRIMRNLGLVAPVGSPFTHAHCKSAS